MSSLYRLPRELQLDILEKLDFQSLPAAIMALAQLYTSMEETSSRTAIFMKYYSDFWRDIMCRHLSDDMVNAGESKPDAMVRLTSCKSYFLHTFSVLTKSFRVENTELTLQDAVHWFYQTAVALEKAQNFVNANFASLLFEAFSKTELTVQDAVDWFYQKAVELEKAQNFFNANFASLLFKAFSKKVSVPLKDQLLGFSAFGSLSAVRLLLPKVPEADKVEWFTQACFHAVAYRQAEVVQHLITQGANVNARSELCITPLHLACRQGSLEIVRFLLSQGANLKARGPRAGTPLNLACSSGHFDIVLFLLSQGADIQVRENDSGQTLLHGACENGHLELTRFLLDKGADLEQVDNDCHTPLHRACIQDHLEVAQLLITQGADLHALDDDYYTPLHLACIKGHLEVARLLITKGANVNALSTRDQTPLHCAIMNGRLEVARLLLARGANSENTDREGQTPLHWACQAGHLATAQLLIDEGASLNARESTTGCTPLELAYNHGHFELVCLLNKWHANRKLKCVMC